MAKINLIPEVKQEKIKIKKINAFMTTLSTVTGIAVLSAVVLLLFLITIKNVEINSINKEITKTNEELKTYANLEEKVVSLEEGLNKINSVLTSKKDWTKFLGELEKVTPEDIQIQNLDMSGQGLNLNVVGKEVKSIDRFIKSFSTYKYKNQNLFTAVTVDGFTKNEKGEVIFGARMNFNEGLLYD